MAMPSVSSSPSAIVYVHTSIVVSLASAQAASFGVPPMSSSSCGVPVTLTAAVNVAVASMTSPIA